MIEIFVAIGCLMVVLLAIVCVRLIALERRVYPPGLSGIQKLRAAGQRHYATEVLKDIVKLLKRRGIERGVYVLEMTPELLAQIEGMVGANDDKGDG